MSTNYHEFIFFIDMIFYEHELKRIFTNLFFLTRMFMNVHELS